MTTEMLSRAVLSGLLLAAPLPSGSTPPTPVSLSPGNPLTRELSAGETQAFRVELPAGRSFRVAVEQRGIDVVVAVVVLLARPIISVAVFAPPAHD